MQTRIRVSNVTIGNEAQAAKELADFYNRHGAMGDRLGNTKVIVKPSGNVTLVTQYESDKDDDGRVIEGMEERKFFGLFRVSDDASEVAAWINTQNELGNNVARPFVTAAGEDTLYFMASCVAPKYDWDDDEDEENEDDDWEDDAEDETEEIPAHQAPTETVSAAPVAPAIPVIPTASESENAAPAQNTVADDVLGDIFG
jgi:hypothetical protein